MGHCHGALLLDPLSLVPTTPRPLIVCAIKFPLPRPLRQVATEVTALVCAIKPLCAWNVEQVATTCRERYEKRGGAGDCKAWVDIGPLP